MWGILRLSARAAAWRTTLDAPLVGLPILLGFAVAAAFVRVALQLLVAGTWHTFNPYGLNAVVALIALELAVAALFVRPAGRAMSEHFSELLRFWARRMPDRLALRFDQRDYSWHQLDQGRDRVPRAHGDEPPWGHPRHRGVALRVTAA